MASWGRPITAPRATRTTSRRLSSAALMVEAQRRGPYPTGPCTQYPDPLQDPKMDPPKNGSITTLGNLGDYEGAPFLWDPLGGLGN